MKRTVLVLVAVLFVWNAGAALGQSRGGSSERYLRLNHTAEISAHYGYVWTGSRAALLDETPGEIDIADSPMWGLQLDIPVRPDAQVVVLYNRQQSDWTWKEGGTTQEVSPVNVEYIHIGGLGGVPQDNLMPYAQVTIGATRFSGMNTASDTWDFSLIFGVGAKLYIHERLALKVQGRLPYTFFSGGVALGVSTGGGFLSVGGTGIIQGDLSAGLSILI